MRGTVAVKQKSLLMRTYEGWRSLAGKPPREQIDLCHFMRVILIFAPWRWFWQQPIRPVGIPPFLILLLTGCLSAIAYAIVRWPGEVLYVAILGVLALLGITVGSLAVAAVYILIRRNPAGWRNTAGAAGYYGFIWLWWPVAEIARAARWFSRVLIEPAGRWLFTRQLFTVSVKDELIPVVPFAVATVALIGIVLWLEWQIIAYGFGALALVLLVVIGVAVGAERLRDRRLARQEEPEDDRERTPSVAWQWLVAKKRRICPLIEVKP